MRHLSRRRWTNLLLLFVGVSLLWTWFHWLDASLSRTAHSTGYLLYGSIILLAAYNLRKKLPGLPLGSSALWLRIHIVSALGTMPLFLWHTSARWPDGWVEATLALLFWGTFLSGLGGLYLSRTLPAQLSRTGEQFIFERIPRLKYAVRTEARSTVLKAVNETGATTLANFYIERLHGFFQKPRSFRYLIRPSGATRKRMFEELEGVRRFLTDGERQASEKLFSLVRKKDDLDYHEARQRILKLWIFVHLSLTCGLLVVGTLHGLLALAYQGGPT